MRRADLPLTFEEVRQRSLRALAVLALRGGAGRLISMGALVLLSRLLTAADFGAFAILMVPIGLLTIVADAGISGAMIQREEPLSRELERVGFTLSLLLAAGLGALALAAAAPLARIYSLGGDAVWALRVLAAGPLLSALGLVPSVRLNRALRFDPLAGAEIGSLLVGQSVSVALAFAGGGVWALALGSLATSASGSILVNILAPWRPGVGLSRAAARALLRFGLRYQSQGLLHLAVDKIIPALGGLWLSGSQVGYLTWAKEVARWPRVPADYVARVGFAAFSRLQGDRPALGRLLQNALMLVCGVTFPVAALGIVLAPHLITPIFGSQWAPAAVPLVLFLLQTPLDALATVLLPVIYAVGSAGRGLRISLLWALLGWVSSALALGATGRLEAIPVAFVLTTALMTLVIARNLPQGLSLRWWPALGSAGAIALLLGTLGRLMVRGMP